MKKFRKAMSGAAVLFLGLVMLAVLGCPQDSDDGGSSAPAGTVYTATGTGTNGSSATTFEVKVTVSDGKITKIELPSPFPDSDGIGKVAAPKVVADILQYQTANVDTVSSATVTSKGVRDAVASALQQAELPASFFAPPAGHTSDTAKHPTLETTENVDVLVIGSGIAGLSAAFQAATDAAGKKIVLIEKLELPGGSTKLSAGVVYAAVDNADVTYLVDFYMDRSQGKADVDLVRYWAENSIQTLSFLDINPTTPPGVPSGTTDKNRMRSAAGGGNGIVQNLLGKAAEKGVKIRYGVKATALTGSSSLVTGVKAEFPNVKTTFNTGAKGSVIIAAGGFDSDFGDADFNPTTGSGSLLHQYNTDSEEDIPASSPESKGEGIKMALAIGAANSFQGGKIGWIVAAPGGMMHYYATVIKGSASSTGGDDGELLDYAPPNYLVDYGSHNAGSTITGYIQHVDDYAVAHKRMLDARTVGVSKFWVISNDAPSPMYTADQQKSATTIADLATAISVDSGRLSQAFGDAADAEMTSGFGPPIVTTGDVFTATIAIPSSIGSMGGLKINANAEVQKTGGGSIPGLYAAGESANGQFFYKEYPGSGSSLSISATMGRTAGAKAAARLTQ